MGLYYYKAKVVRVIDGDGLVAIVELGFNVSVQINFRLNGVDTPESRTSYELEDKAGELLKQYLIDLVEGKDIYILSNSVDKGKFGRYLGEIYLSQGDEYSLNKFLIKEGLARPYHGRAKAKWSEDELSYIVNKLQQQ